MFSTKNHEGEMLNIEKHKEEIYKVMDMDHGDIALKDGKVCNCNLIDCEECDFKHPIIVDGCKRNRIHWFLRSFN